MLAGSRQNLAVLLVQKMGVRTQMMCEAWEGHGVALWVLGIAELVIFTLVF